MRRALLAAVYMAVLWSEPSWAYRDSFTTEQKAQLVKIQVVLVDAIVLTDTGARDTAPLADIITRRMGALGYTMVRDQTSPHDVTVKIKCEQRKTWEGTTPTGGDADVPDAPLRLWKGPACQMTYRLGDIKVKWQREIRTDFEDATTAAQAAQAQDAGAYSLEKLQEGVDKYEFPLLLTAEWRQPDRLLKLLDASETSLARKVKIIALLGEMQADEALPRLTQALQDRNLSKEAAVALGNLGQEGIPLLVDILKTSTQPELQAAAAKGLGKLGGLHGDGSVVDPLLAMLDAPGIHIHVQTEIVWALGKIVDKRSLPPLNRLFKKTLLIRDPDNKDLRALLEALNWSTKQIDVEEHIS